MDESKYFVYYDDCGEDDVGMEECNTVEKAGTFIVGRVKKDPTNRSAKDYTVVYGKKQKIVITTAVTVTIL